MFSLLLLFMFFLSDFFFGVVSLFLTYKFLNAVNEGDVHWGASTAASSGSTSASHSSNSKF
jgi:hypothetical protein